MAKQLRRRGPNGVSWFCLLLCQKRQYRHENFVRCHTFQEVHIVIERLYGNFFAEPLSQFQVGSYSSRLAFIAGLKDCDRKRLHSRLPWLLLGRSGLSILHRRASLVISWCHTIMEFLDDESFRNFVWCWLFTIVKNSVASYHKETAPLLMV